MGLTALDCIGAGFSTVAIANADGTTQKTLVATQQRTRLVLRCTAVNNDTIDHVLAFGHSNTPQTRWGSVTVPAGAGFNGVPATDCMPALVPNAGDALILTAGAYLYCYVEVAMVGAYQMGVSCHTGELGPWA